MKFIVKLIFITILTHNISTYLGFSASSFNSFADFMGHFSISFLLWGILDWTFTTTRLVVVTEEKLKQFYEEIKEEERE